MKVDNRGVIPISTARSSAKKVQEANSSKSLESTNSDRVSSRLSKALDSAVKGIESSGLSAGQVHSEVDEARAQGLLKSIDVQEKRPQMNTEDLLKLADKVVSDSQKNPQQAAAAFNHPDSGRVADLV